MSDEQKRFINALCDLALQSAQVVVEKQAHEEITLHLRAVQSIVLGQVYLNDHPMQNTYGGIVRIP